MFVAATDFSHVLGVLSANSSIVSLPAGSSPMFTSRKTRGLDAVAMYEWRLLGSVRAEDDFPLQIIKSIAGQL